MDPGPAFQWDFARSVYGPGVARAVPSSDGKEDWIYYHTKVWETWNGADCAREEGQQTKEMWTRFVDLQKIGWQRVVHEGRAYTIPDLGEPPAPGARLALPGGDPGPALRATCKTEAERSAFGAISEGSARTCEVGKPRFLRRQGPIEWQTSLTAVVGEKPSGESRLKYEART